MLVANFLFGLLIAFVILILAILSVTGVFGAEYSKYAWWYTIVVGSLFAYVFIVTMVGSDTTLSNEPFLERFKKNATKLGKTANLVSEGGPV